MRCERLLVFLLLFAACSRESAAPEPPEPTPPRDLTTSATTTPAAPPMATPIEPVPPPPSKGNYDQAMQWLRSAKGFRFVLDEGPLHAEGKMTRQTQGMESLEVKANGEEWRAEVGAQGVTWERRSKGTWTSAPPPPYGNRLFQRVTIAFDPQKREGTPQLIAEGPTNHWRFTNANTGEVHELWVAQSDNHVERMKIGESFEMKITP